MRLVRQVQNPIFDASVLGGNPPTTTGFAVAINQPDVSSIVRPGL